MVVTSCTCTNNTAATTDSTENVPNPLTPETLDQLFVWNSYYASDNNNDINVYQVSQRRDETKPLTDLYQQALFRSLTQDNIYGIPVQLGPFAMEGNPHGACTYTATASGNGGVSCRNIFAIKCYDLAAGNTSQTKRSFVIELGTLLIICSNSI
jgi:hypothetical protein